MVASLSVCGAPVAAAPLVPMIKTKSDRLINPGQEVARDRQPTDFRKPAIVRQPVPDGSEGWDANQQMTVGVEHMQASAGFVIGQRQPCQFRLRLFDIGEVECRPMVVIKAPIVLDLAPTDGTGTVKEDSWFVSHVRLYGRPDRTDQQSSNGTGRDRRATLTKERR